MQDSTPAHSVTKPNLRKSLRLRKKRFSNEFQNKKCASNSRLLFAPKDSVDAALRLNEASPSPSNELLPHSIKSNDDRLVYSSLLLELCNKLVKEDEAKSRTAAANGGAGLKRQKVPIYSPLTQDSLLYPYANLLVGLHKKVAPSGCQATKHRKQPSLPDHSLSRIMNDLDLPIDPNTNEYKVNCDTTTTNSYTKKIQNFVILEALRKTILNECDSSGKLTTDRLGEGATVGEVMSDLGRQRPRPLYPSNEFYYSSLLLKACSANGADQHSDLHLVSDGGGDTGSNTTSCSDDRDCLTSISSDSYEEWSPSYRKRKVRRVKRRSTKSLMGKRRSSTQVLVSPGEARNTHQNNAPTLLKLLLSKDGTYDGAGSDSFPSQSRSSASASSLPPHGSSTNGLHGSLLKNFLSKPSDEFQKYYSKIRENKENSSARSLHNDTDVKCLRGQSNHRSASHRMHRVKKDNSSIPDLIPCGVLSDAKSSCVTDVIKSESSEVDVGCTFLEENDSKPAPQAMSLTVASMLCRLKLYSSGEGVAESGDMMAPCTATVSSAEDKQGLGTSNAGRCRTGDEESALEEHQCSLCHLPFVSSLDLQCHQSLFHASHSTSEKLRN